jgi:hypothetical protein
MQRYAEICGDGPTETCGGGLQTDIKMSPTLEAETGPRWDRTVLVSGLSSAQIYYVCTCGGGLQTAIKAWVAHPFNRQQPPMEPAWSPLCASPFTLRLPVHTAPASSAYQLTDEPSIGGLGVNISRCGAVGPLGYVC